MSNHREYEFHHGERAVQERAGVATAADRIRRSIHPTIPDRAAEFLNERKLAVIAARDADGLPWVSILTGPAGFLHAPDGSTLRVEATLHDQDPVARTLLGGVPVGLLAIDFETRRRVRINGTVGQVRADGFDVAVQQAYANCPKYIQVRAEAAEPRQESRHEPARTTRALDARQLDLIRNADTFFIGTAVPGEGADASHRGGEPGFVRATATRIEWPDYAGNSMFNTLGNIHAFPYAGLAFIDFEAGTLIQLTGSATIDWDSEAADWPGAERLVRVEVERVIETTHRLPVLASPVEYSPFNPPVAVGRRTR